MGDSSYRLFNCAHCHKQVKICRQCDRGNRYCSARCRELRRKQAVREAGTRYRRSCRGKLKQAARQDRYRARMRAKKVTHQGSPSGVRHAIFASTTSRQRNELDVIQAKAPGAVRCDSCGEWCGPFARYEPWRRGRRLAKRKGGKHADHKRTGSGDSPLIPC